MAPDGDARPSRQAYAPPPDEPITSDSGQTKCHRDCLTGQVDEDEECEIMDDSPRSTFWLLPSKVLDESRIVNGFVRVRRKKRRSRVKSCAFDFTTKYVSKTVASFRMRQLHPAIIGDHLPLELRRVVPKLIQDDKNESRPHYQTKLSTSSKQSRDGKCPAQILS
ncbi:hypothetical protein EK21DRAFT_90586 [Setomelanomma holmii]|uniref:Uncharacterized protein n=1 Tax=Setomelanomma holmii TaxID=210430 RepID=A0A9P4LIV2_9PLEO|nr:hypothetical protein EK21DRAFT_90586 [Setomelanomma holmii]